MRQKQAPKEEYPASYELLKLKVQKQRFEFKKIFCNFFNVSFLTTTSLFIETVINRFCGPANPSLGSFRVLVKFDIFTLYQRERFIF